MDYSEHQNDTTITNVEEDFDTLDKEGLLGYYLKHYTADNRLGFCKLARRKYRFEKYKMSVRFEDIEPEDFIVQNSSTLAKIDQIIKNNKCSVEEFTNVFNDLSLDEINYIGF